MKKQLYILAIMTGIISTSMGKSCENFRNYSTELKYNMDFFQEQAIKSYQKDKNNQAFDAYFLSRYIYINSKIDLFECLGKTLIYDKSNHNKDKKVWLKYKIYESIAKKNKLKTEKFKGLLLSLK